MTCHDVMAFRGKGSVTRAELAAVVKHMQACDECAAIINRVADKCRARCSDEKNSEFESKAKRDFEQIMADPESAFP